MSIGLFLGKLWFRWPEGECTRNRIDMDAFQLVVPLRVVKWRLGAVLPGHLYLKMLNLPYQLRQKVLLILEV
jgi:hypothetical protein